MNTGKIIRQLRTVYGKIDRFEFCNDAADRLEAHEQLLEKLKNGIIHADIYGDGNIGTGALTALIERESL